MTNPELLAVSQRAIELLARSFETSGRPDIAADVRRGKVQGHGTPLWMDEALRAIDAALAEHDLTAEKVDRTGWKTLTRAMLDRLRDSQGIPDGDRVEVDFRALVDVLGAALPAPTQQEELCVSSDPDPLNTSDVVDNGLNTTTQPSFADEREAEKRITILRRALAWHGDLARMATTREDWQQEIDAAIAWVKANPEDGRPSFPSLALRHPEPSHGDLVEALERMKAAGHSVLSAMDDHNAEHGTHLGGPAFFEMGRAIHQADLALSERNGA